MEILTEQLEIPTLPEVINNVVETFIDTLTETIKTQYTQVFLNNLYNSDNADNIDNIDNVNTIITKNKINDINNDNNKKQTKINIDMNTNIDANTIVETNFNTLSINNCIDLLSYPVNNTVQSGHINTFPELTKLNNIIAFDTSNNKQLHINSHNNSVAESSEFSYRKNIKETNIPATPVIINNKNVRISKKNKSKGIELDDTDYLYNRLQDYQRNIIIDRRNYILIIMKAMEIIETRLLANDKSNKKEIVIQALNRLFIIDLVLNDFDKRLILSTIDNIIESIINCSKSHSNKLFNIHDNYNNIENIGIATCGQLMLSVIDKLITIVIKKQYTSDKIFVNMTTITEILIILVEKYTFLNCLEKKMIVTNAMNIFIIEKIPYIIDISESSKKDLIYALDTVPMIIDLIIAIKNNKSNINNKLIINIKKNKWYKLCCGDKSEETIE